MNASEIMKQIEDGQMKESVSEFHVGDTVKVYGKSWKVPVKESRYLKESY